MAVPQGPYYKALGSNLRTLRKKKDLTQAQLAVAVGLTRTSITNIEMGRQPVYIHILVKLAEQVDATIQELLPAIAGLDSTLEPHLAGFSEHHKEWIASVISEEHP